MCLCLNKDADVLELARLELRVIWWGENEKNVNPFEAVFTLDWSWNVRNYMYKTIKHIAIQTNQFF
jgi:hypothetical protein